jgi:3-hydroxybutyryl-CoA dehydrogenase
MSVHLEHRFVVVGTGIMASGIVAGFIAQGAHVLVLGRSAQRCEQTCAAALGLAQAMAPQAKAPQAAQDLPGRLQSGLLQGWTDWQGVSLVIETVAEDLALKQTVFAQLDAAVPEHIPIGSNSSGFPISKIAQGLKGARRMFNVHYFMPAHVVPLVEVVLGAASDAALGQSLCELFTAMGKKPVLVRRDIPGFLANRIQHAMMREALSLIDAGIATPADVDLAVRYSFGFRYAAVGPIVQKEISGWDSVCSAAQAIYPSLSNVSEVPACLLDMVQRGHTGMKSGQGFMAWTPDTTAATQRSYEKKLRAAFEILQSDD